MQSLFQICLDFTAKNITHVDSLEEFPELIGYMLAQRVVDCRTGQFCDSVRLYSMTLSVASWYISVLLNIVVGISLSYYIS